MEERARCRIPAVDVVLADLAAPGEAGDAPRAYPLSILGLTANGDLYDVDTAIAWRRIAAHEGAPVGRIVTPIELVESELL
jgi:hypothetical protein